MKKIILLFLCSAVIASCSNSKTDKAKAEQEIIKADRDMSALATQEGFLKALLQYADKDVVKLNDGVMPIVGKDAFAKSVGDKTGTKSLTWEPVKVEVAQSGELGYSWGNWKWSEKDTTYYGNYFTVWKKQADGSWKFVLDGGNNTPNPATK